MFSALIFVHVLMCIILILIVLLQTGKGADIGAAFGGGSQTLFGSAGPTSFFGKLTTAAAVIFMITSLTLAWWSTNRKAVSVIPDVKEERTDGKGKLPVPKPGEPLKQSSTPSQPAQPK